MSRVRVEKLEIAGELFPATLDLTLSAVSRRQAVLHRGTLKFDAGVRKEAPGFLNQIFFARP